MNWKQTSYGAFSPGYAVRQDGDDYRAYHLVSQGARQRTAFITTSGQVSGGYNGSLGSNKHTKDRAIFFKSIEAAKTACEIHAGHMSRIGQ